MKDPKLRPYIISEVCKLVSNEVKEVCSTKHDSILRMKTKPAVEGFTWDRVWGELKEKVPVLLQILREATPHQSLHTVKPALCMCVNILLKLRNPHMNLLQGMISIVLRTGHATKQVQKRSVGKHYFDFTTIADLQAPAKADAMPLSSSYIKHARHNW